jgi:hypothetical protein
MASKKRLEVPHRRQGTISDDDVSRRHRSRQASRDRGRAGGLGRHGGSGKAKRLKPNQSTLPPWKKVVRCLQRRPRGRRTCAIVKFALAAIAGMTDPATQV